MKLSVFLLALTTSNALSTKVTSGGDPKPRSCNDICVDSYGGCQECVDTCLSDCAGPCDDFCEETYGGDERSVYLCKLWEFCKVGLKGGSSLRGAKSLASLTSDQKEASTDAVNPNTSDISLSTKDTFEGNCDDYCVETYGGDDRSVEICKIWLCGTELKGGSSLRSAKSLVSLMSDEKEASTDAVNLTYDPFQRCVTRCFYGSDADFHRCTSRCRGK